jgi:hypothetical protein
VAVAEGTLSVTITLAVVKAVPASPRADSLPVVVAVGSGIARAADARADDAKRNGGGGASRDGDASRVRISG